MFFQLLFVPPVLAIAALSYKGNGPWVLLGLGGVLAAGKPVSIVRKGAKGRDLIAVLGATGRTQLVTGLVTAIGIALSA